MHRGHALILAFALLIGTSVAGQAASANEYGQHNEFPVPVTRTAEDVQLLWSRLRSGLPPKLYRDFDLFIYVNKAEGGPWAQHLYAFSKPSNANPDSEVILMLDTAVSTGRETIERAKNGQQVSTSTPAGFFELDPERFEVGHRSKQWQLDMPNAMFFDWNNNGAQTGLAIHGVTDAQSIAALGHRASAGCIQLSLDASRKLFDLVRDNFEGKVPRFAYDTKTRTTKNTGELARDEGGQIMMDDGYRALVIIEDLEDRPLTSELLTSPTTHPEKFSGLDIHGLPPGEGTGAPGVLLVSLVNDKLSRLVHQSRPQPRAPERDPGPNAGAGHLRVVREVLRN
jgi:hypothetical protein